MFLARVDPTAYDSNGDRSPVDCSIATSFKAEPPLGSNSGVYGTFDAYRGFHALNVPDNSSREWTGAEDCYGFMGSLTTRTVGGKQTYNFYAEGSAPNYFNGPCYFRPAGKVTLTASLRPTQDCLLVVTHLEMMVVLNCVVLTMLLTVLSHCSLLHLVKVLVNRQLSLARFQSTPMALVSATTKPATIASSPTSNRRFRC